jgi:hypothetical protein
MENDWPLGAIYIYDYGTGVPSGNRYAANRVRFNKNNPQWKTLYKGDSETDMRAAAHAESSRLGYHVYWADGYEPKIWVGESGARYTVRSLDLLKSTRERTMADKHSTGKVTLYDVSWHVLTVPTEFRTRVSIREGYSTVEDIPKILAVARTGRADNASVIVVDSMREVTE